MFTRAFSGILLGLVLLLWVVSLILAPEESPRCGDLLVENLFWLAAALALGISFFFRPRAFTGTDCLMALFALAALLSWTALINGWTGNRFFAACQSGTILLLPASYFVLRFFPRQTNPSIPLRKLLGTFLLALFLAQSFFAVYCYSIRDPALRAQYRADPEKMLAENSLVIPPGTPERELFENRLNSVEPLGTFCLTNTLAGFLVPVLTFLATLFLWELYRLIACRRSRSGEGIGKEVAKGIGKEIAKEISKEISKEMPSRPDNAGTNNAGTNNVINLLLPALMLALGGYALFLTKSRTGILAFFCGIGLALALLGARLMPRVFRLALAALPFLLALLLLGGWAAGILDREFFTEAKKSLSFRLDYWEASARMIAEYPWLGVGPGNFQSIYPRFMNAAASEVIADPHNFVLEIASLLGLPALAAFLAFLLRVCYLALRSPETTDAAGYAAPDATGTAVPDTSGTAALACRADEKSMGMFKSLFWGLFFVASCVIAFSLSLKNEATVDFDFLFCAASAIPLALIFSRRFFGRAFPRRWYLPALVAGGINLLAAGGIFYPPTALPLIFLCVLSLPPAEGLPRGDNTARVVHYSIAGIWVILLLISSVAIYRTTILSGRAQRLEERCRQTSPASLEQLETYLETEPTRRGFPCGLDDYIPLRTLRFSTATAIFARSPSGDTEALSRLLASKRALLETAPSSASIRFNVGKSLLELGTLTRGITRTALFCEAEEAFAEAIERFPTNAEYRLYHALSLSLLEKRDLGKEELTRGLALDEGMTHSDRKLSEELKKRAVRAVEAVDLSKNGPINEELNQRDTGDQDTGD